MQIQDYIENITRVEPDLLRELAEQTRVELDDPGMMSSRSSGRLLKLLIQLSQPENVLEIGMYSGYATLSMAEGLSQSGHIYTCEMDTKAIQFAQSYFDRSPHGKKISVMEGNAVETIEKLGVPLDFVFIDADKERYPIYYEMSIERLRPGGLIVVDNALWSGQVCNPQSEEDFAIAHTNDLMQRDERVENVLIPVRDGLHIARKK